MSSTDYDYGTLPVMYIRHLTNISKEGLRDLCEQNLIGVHWKDIRSRDPTDYDNGATDIEALNDIDETGAIVAAYYGSDTEKDGKSREGIHKSKMFIGVVPPDTFEYHQFPKLNGENTTYKTLQFDEDTLKSVSVAERPDLFSDVPARGTIKSCDKTEDRLREIVNPKRSPSPIDSPNYVDHNEFEHICTQYLNLIEFPGEFYTVISPGGKDGNMEVIDINGGVGDRPVVAQVTQASGLGEVKQKVQTLEKEFVDHEFVYMFGPEKYVEKFKSNDVVEYVGAQTVFEELNTNPKTRPLMARLPQR